MTSSSRPCPKSQSCVCTASSPEPRPLRLSTARPCPRQPHWFTGMVAYNGKSYVFMVAYLGTNDYPSEVWISSIDPANPLARRITDTSLLRARNDPEVFITDTFGPMIYYNRYDPSIDPAHPLCADCSEGVYRANPGLLGR